MNDNLEKPASPATREPGLRLVLILLVLLPLIALFLLPSRSLMHGGMFF